MLNYLKKFFTQAEQDKEPTDDSKKLQVATCALFIEMAKADSHFSSEEEQKIISIMKSTFNLDDEVVSDLWELAERDIKESISLYEFTTIIDQNFSKDEKFKLMKNLWRLIYVDDKLDKYEDQLVKRIGKMINLDYPDIFGAKLLVKKEKSNN